jgi:adenylate cyclase
MWPAHRHEILDWLVTSTQGDRFIDNIFVEMCNRLRAQGVSVARATLFLNINHPLWRGARFLWEAGATSPTVNMFDYGLEESERYINSPIRAIEEGTDKIRRRLDDESGTEPWYPIYTDLKAVGMTDYLAYAVKHTQGRRQIVTFASDGPDGFSEADLALFDDIVPVLALISEIRVKNRLARTLLETYVGPHASEQVLAGATRRGDGATISAAILVCDLRDFTTISDQWPRDDVIGLLNRYFDAVSEPIEQNGGEILKFMGDGLLAVFPLDNPKAFEGLLTAIDEAKRNMLTILVEHDGSDPMPLGFGIGVHVGDVMYGNIGSKRRLDFTVIGPAVNIASRLETLTKTVGRQVLFSEDFVTRSQTQDRMERVGRYPVKGVREPVEVFTLRQT